MTVRMMNVVMLVWCLAAAEVETAAVVTEGEGTVVVEYQREGIRPKQPQQPSNGVSQEKSGLVQQDIGDTISADRETAECFKEKVKEKFKEPRVDTETSDSYGACKGKSLGMLESAKNVVKDVHEKLFTRKTDAKLLIRMAAGQVVQESENLARWAKVVGKKVVDNTKKIGGMVMEMALSKAKKLKGSTLDAITNIMEKMGPSLSEIAQEMAHDLKEKAMNAYSYVERKLHQTDEKDWNAITKIAENGLWCIGIAQGMARDVIEKAMNTYSYVERNVDQAKEKDWNARALAASRRIIDGTNNIGREVIGRALEKAKQVKGGGFNDIAYRAKIIGSSVSETAQEMAHDVQVKTSNAYSHIEEKVLQAKKAWKVHGSVFCKKVVDSANDVGREVKAIVLNNAKKMKGSAVDAVTKGVQIIGHSLLETALKVAHYVGQKVVDSANDVCKKVVDSANDVGREVKAIVLNNAKKMKGSAVDAVTKGVQIIGHSLLETALKVAHYVGQKARNGYHPWQEKVYQAKEKPQQTKEITGTSDNLAGQMVHEKKVHEATCHGKYAADDEGRGELSQMIREGGAVIYDAVAHAVAPETFCFLMNVLHSLAFSVVSGTCFWVTFIWSQVLSRILSRQQFKLVQSKIYPVYFRTMACGIAICLATHLAICRWASASQAHKLEAYNLLVSLGFVLTNVCLRSQTVKVMHNRLKLDKEARCHKSDMGQGELTLSSVATNITAVAAHNTSATKTAGNVHTTTKIVHMEQEVAKLRLVQMNRRLKNLNRYSSVLNVMSLMGLTWHQVHLSQQVSC